MGGCYAHIHEQGQVSGILKLVPSIVGRAYHCLVLSKQIGCQRMQFCWCQQAFQQLVLQTMEFSLVP